MKSLRPTPSRTTPSTLPRESPSTSSETSIFISTHNPYFLLPILEKTLSEDIAVFITYYDDHHTQVRQLAQDELETIFDDVDVFSNIDMFLED